MAFRLATLTLLALFVVSATAFSPFPTCRGSATYKVTFFNLLTGSNFKGLIPASGLVYSPLAGTSHSGRISFFTIRGFANRPTAILAKTGVNTPYIRFAKKLRAQKRGVLSIVDAGAPTMPGKSLSVVLKVNCFHSFLTVIGMIAPSPDWIVQINNRNMFDTSTNKYIPSAQGDLIAYDTGVDDGREFTPPLDLSLDIPTRPQQNIAPLVEDVTDRFEGRNVGKYTIRRIA